MQIKTIVSVLALAGGLGITTVHATGIPVLDVANLANSIQQVVAWGGQSGQMVQQIQLYAQQIQQMQNMTTKFDAARNLGTILNNPAIRSMLPPEMQNANQILSSAISGNQQAAVNSILAAYSMPVTPANPQLGQGSALMISNMQAVLASGQARQVQLDQLASRVDSSPDAKSSLDLLNRNVIESANASNQLMQTIASIEANRAANELRATASDRARKQAVAASQRASR